MSFKKDAIPIMAVIILTTFTYLGSFYVPFMLDDYHVVQVNPNIRDISSIGLGGRSLLMYSFAINYYLGGMNTFGYHLINLVIHIICSILVYYIALSIFSQIRKDKETENRIISTFCALAFALHPLHIGTVVVVSSRSSILMAMFFLLSLLFYTCAEKNKKMLILSFLMFILALLSKEDAITLPFIIILYDLCFNIEKFNLTILLKRSIKFYSIYLAALLTGIIFLRINLTRMTMDIFTPQAFGSTYEHILTGLKSILYYIKLIYLPIGYSTEYYVKIAHSFLELKVLISFFVILALIISGIILYKKHSWATFCTYWFFITLIPTTTFVVMRDLVTDRWVYLPSVGLILLIPCMFLCSELNIKQTKLLPLNKKTALYFGIIVIILFLILSWYRISLYTDEEKLWNDTLEKNPYSFYALNSLGALYMKKGELGNAEEQFVRIIEYFNDTSAEARTNLASIYHKRGQDEIAISHINKALQINAIPRVHAQMHIVLARIYNDQNQTKLREENLQKAKELSPQFYNNLYNQFFNNKFE